MLPNLTDLPDKLIGVNRNVLAEALGFTFGGGGIKYRKIV